MALIEAEGIKGTATTMPLVGQLQASLETEDFVQNVSGAFLNVQSGGGINQWLHKGTLFLECDYSLGSTGTQIQNNPTNFTIPTVRYKGVK